jgi:DedD protein
MEKKKLLLVAVSVGVVLIIIIAIPLFFISSKQDASSSSLALRTGEPAVVYEPYQPAEIIPQPPMEIEPQESAYTPAYIIEDPVYTPAVVKPTETPRVNTITVPAPQTAAVPRASDIPSTTAAARPVQRPAQTQPAEVKPAETVIAAPKPAAPAAPAPRPAVIETGRTRSDYWIQTGAFSSKISAEREKESLQRKGITSIIVNSEIDGKTWYRVRVGPYTTENEAKYWLALVKAIDGFAQSQIRQTAALR